MGIKNLFFVEEPSVAKVNPQSVSEPIRKETFTPMASTNTVVSESPNEEMVSQIWEVIIEKNLPGPDYLELRNNASALEGLPLSEEQKLEAAFKVLKKSYPNLTKDTIVRSIDTYIGIVNDEHKSGLAQCKELRAKQVGEMETRVKQLKETASDMMKQIEDLKKRYEETMTSVNGMEHQILTTSQEIDARERAFTASIDSAISVLSSDKTKVSNLNI